MGNQLFHRSGPASPPSSNGGQGRSGIIQSVAPASGRISSGNHPVATSKRYALVVDDDDASLRTFERLLVKVPGVEILLAQNPSQALGLLSMLDPTPQPIVGFLDVLIPGMDGPRFVHALRTMPQFGAAPVVLISALSAAALDGKAIEWGASGVIQKARGLIHVDTEFKGWLERVG